jgi:hypothetical protein
VGRRRWCANRYRVLAFVAEGDLILIPTVACRSGGIPPGRRAGGISRTRGGARRIGGARGARGGTLANSHGVAVSEVSLLRGFAHRYRVLAFVAEGNLILAIATFPLFGEGHGYHKQYAQHHHRSYHAKDRHITAHTHPTPLCGWVCAMSLVGNIASKGSLSAPRLTLAPNIVKTRATLRICHMAISWKALRESKAGNTRKLL